MQTDARPSVFIYRGIQPDGDLPGAMGRDRRHIVVNFSQDIFADEHFGPGVSVALYGHYLPVHEGEQLLEQARMLGHRWFEGLPKDSYVYDGFSLGEVTAYDFVIVLVEALKSLRLAERIIEAEQPDRILLVDDGSVVFRAFRAVCRAKDVEFLGLLAQVPSGRLLVEQPALLTWTKVALGKCFVEVCRLIEACRPTPRARLRVLLPQYFRFKALVSGLAADPRFEVNVVGGAHKSIFGSFVRRGSVRYLPSLGYLRFKQAAAVARYRRRLQRCLDDLDIVASQGPRFDGYPLLEVCRPLVAEHLRSRFVNYAAFVEVSRAVLTRERITHVIVNQDIQGYQRILCLVANALGVKTICYQHGVSPKIPTIATHISQTVAVWGERERNLYLELGHASADQIRVIGDPFIANLSQRQFDRSTICRRLGLDPTRPVILMPCERYVNFHAPWERETTASERLAKACEVLGRRPEAQLLVRFKADFLYAEFGGSVATQHRIIERFDRGNIHLDSGGDIYERLHVADIVVVTISTIGLEAMMFGKPVIVFADGADPDLVGYVRSGAAVLARTSTEFQAAVNECLDSEALRARLRPAQQRFVEFNFANLNDSDPLASLRDLLTQGQGARHDSLRQAREAS
jgi:glycosyltransferase involved in cell wall biosynthesis